jgi:hypothetical protein
MGGRVIILDGTDGRIRLQSEDLGLGGMAMAVKDLNGDGYDEILFAPVVGPVDSVLPPSPPNTPRGGWIQAFVHVLQVNANGTALQRISTQPIGDPYAGDLHGYGAAGIAVAELYDATTGPEVIVTTLNGEIVVFSQTNGVLNAAPLFRTILDTSLGAFNSIVVDNFDTRNLEKPEIYIASSTGVRKFYVQ